jgi:hypothetical protein
VLGKPAGQELGAACMGVCPPACGAGGRSWGLLLGAPLAPGSPVLARCMCGLLRVAVPVSEAALTAASSQQEGCTACGSVPMPGCEGICADTHGASVVRGARAASCAGSRGTTTQCTTPEPGHSNATTGKLFLSASVQYVLWHHTKTLPVRCTPGKSAQGRRRMRLASGGCSTL